jgi:ATP-dependent DNA ligase
VKRPENWLPSGKRTHCLVDLLAEGSSRCVFPCLRLNISAGFRKRRAADWFRRFEGASFYGVMAKPVSGTYDPDKRLMLKVKHERECDCVVAGFRWHKKGDPSAVGLLLFGLFDGDVPRSLTLN